MTLCISHTGRRPIQISLLRVVDVLCGKNEKGEPILCIECAASQAAQRFFPNKLQAFCHITGTMGNPERSGKECNCTC
ncbi:DNA breaking-rejoining enzyme [Escherichia coli]|nr:DNA breaking-rejoining enzyme [Escherichia coli]